MIGRFQIATDEFVDIRPVLGTSIGSSINRKYATTQDNIAWWLIETARYGRFHQGETAHANIWRI
jgi:hypothetical protein